MITNITNVLLLIGTTIFVAFILLFCYVLYRLHTSLNVHVNPSDKQPSDYDLKPEVRQFKTKDNITISSWYLPVKNAKAVIILVHGFQNPGGGKGLMLMHAKYLHDGGYTILLLDLRSNGDSPGKKVTLGVTEWQDVEAAYDYLKSLPENKDKKIGFFGNSMGAATSITATGITGKGDFVIASVPYANLQNLFIAQTKKEHLPSMIFVPLLRIAAILELGWRYEYYSPSHWITKIHKPILLISAKHDAMVLPSDARYLYDLANKPKEYWQANTSHDIFEDNPEEFKRKVLEFILSSH